MSDNALPRFSVSISSTHRADGPARMIERTRVAHRAGFGSLSIGDHHDMGVPYAQNTPMLGRLLAEWPGRPAGCLFLVPLWKPLLMAEHIGTLAAIHQIDSPGSRFIVQTGIGWGEAQFTNMGAAHNRRGRDIDAALPVVKALLAGETVDDDYFGLKGARVGQRADVDYDWWIGAGVPVAVERAARHGAWYTGPGVSDDAFRARVDAFRSAGGTQIMARRDVVIAADADDADERASAIIERGYRGMNRDQLLVGSADQVAERCAELKALGVDEIVVRCASSEQDHALESLEVLGSLI